jgi:peptidoglycan/LPS O-acetylase OafA/YrhL
MLTEELLSPTLSPVAIPVSRPDGRSKGSIALDQWRGLALIFVLISHGFFFTDLVNGAGRMGVNLFFFISGILVYRSLNRSLSGSGMGENKWRLASQFWVKRLIRLYPALIAYVLTMLLAVIFLQKLPNLPPRSDFMSYLRAVPWALSYLINYVQLKPYALGHLWSLACEMQFYALAPIVFLLGGRKERQRLFIYGAVTVVFVASGLIYPFRMVYLDYVKYHFEVAAWPMMLGLFCEFAKRWFLKIPYGVVKVIFGLGVTAMIVSLIAMPFGMQMKKLVIILGALLILPCFLGYLFGLALPGRIGSVLAWIGERTYSIYLWQQPFTLCNFLPPMLHPAGAAMSIGVGAFWFLLFEKPFLSPNRVHQVALSNSRDQIGVTVQ